MHTPHDALVSIDIYDTDFRALFVAQRSKRLPRARSEGLSLLRRVDLGEANPDLLEVAVQNSEGVTIRNGHHQAEDHCSGCYQC